MEDNKYMEVNGKRYRVIKKPNTTSVPNEILNDIIRYCEHQSIYDKLGSYGDFYYKLKKLMK